MRLALHFAKVFEDRLNVRGTLRSTGNAWERGRPARLGALIGTPDADETSALPGPLSPFGGQQASAILYETCTKVLGSRETLAQVISFGTVGPSIPETRVDTIRAHLPYTASEHNLQPKLNLARNADDARDRPHGCARKNRRIGQVKLRSVKDVEKLRAELDLDLFCNRKVLKQ